MKQSLYAFLLFLSIFVLSCGGTATTKLIKKTANDATIQGVGPTEKDANIAAEEIAKKTFGEFVIYKKDPCTTITEAGKTTYTCIIYVNKK